MAINFASEAEDSVHYKEIKILSQWVVMGYKKFIPVLAACVCLANPAACGDTLLPTYIPGHRTFLLDITYDLVIYSRRKEIQIWLI